MKHIYLSLIISVFMWSGLQAQTESEDVTENHSGFRSISLLTGYYSPSLDYYNDRTSFQYTGSLFFSIYGEYWVANLPMTVRLGAGYYSTNAKVEGSETILTEEQTINLIPVDLDVLWRFEKIYTYVGVGLGYNFVTTKYKGPETSMDQSGYAPKFQGLVGFEYPLSTSFSIGAEVQYVMGSFTQQVGTETNFTDEKVSINGPKIGLKLSYLF